MRQSAITLCLLLGVLAAAGCQSNSSSGSTVSGARPGATPTAGSANPDSTRLRAGLAPISYMLGTGGTVRIIDATDGSELYNGAVGAQSIINIDTTKGISVSNNSVRAGPLPQGHRYEIWLDRK